MASLRHHNAIKRSIDEQHFGGWAPNGRAVRQARAHLADMKRNDPERYAMLMAEWEEHHG